MEDSAEKRGATVRFEDGDDVHEWPNDMTIRVSDGANLIDLLWLRHMAVGNAEPSLPPAAIPGEPVSSDDHRLVGIWEKLWKESLEHSRRIQELAPRAVAEHPELWAAPDIGAFADELGLDVGEGVRAWRDVLDFHNAERAVVEDVRVAWQRGLRTVIELPLAAGYWRRLSAATLVVSTVTRRNQAGYSEALRSFVRN
jgi:hypothetical protein